MEKEKTLFAMDLAAMMAVEELAAEEKKSTDEVLLSFMESNTGKMLYNDSTKLWWEGPTVVAEEYKKEMKKQKIKKQISILLLTLSLTFAFAAPNTPKGTKLSVKKKFAIEGVELGSISWGKGTLTAKGEILWTETNEWQEIGWELRGVDMSQYGALRIELAKGNNDELRVLLTNAECTGDWVYTFDKDVAFLYFNGAGRTWGDLKELGLKEGLLIRIGGESNPQNPGDAAYVLKPNEGGK